MDRRLFLKLTGAAGIAASLPAGCASPRAAVQDAADPLLESLIDAARSAGAEYADARFISLVNRSVQVRKNRVYSAADSEDAGVALRVYRNGGWGQAASSDITGISPVKLAAEAMAAASVSASLRPAASPAEGRPRNCDLRWATPLERDPFDVPLDEVTAFLLGLTERAMRTPKIEYAVANMFAMRREMRFLNTRDARLSQRQTTLWVNAGVTVFDSSTGSIDNRVSRFAPVGGGWEHITAHPFDREIDEAVADALAMQAASPLQSMRYDLVMDPSHHWSVIDRLLAPALDPMNVGGFDGSNPAHRLLTPADIGATAFASAKLTVDADITLERGTATRGWDDEGRTPGRSTVVREGVYMGFPGMEDAHAGSSWQAAPRFAMPNLIVRPPADARPLSAMIADTQLGVLLAGRGFFDVSTDRSWFRARAEQAWLIESGKIARMVRDFEYESRTRDFFGALAEVGSAQDAAINADLFPASSGGTWELPFSISTPAARYTNIATFSTREARS